jgi:hypothetical protein
MSTEHDTGKVPVAVIPAGDHEHYHPSQANNDTNKVNYDGSDDDGRAHHMSRSGSADSTNLPFHDEDVSEHTPAHGAQNVPVSLTNGSQVPGSLRGHIQSRTVVTEP